LELLEEPKAGMKVRGIVTNAASFGVFVDIGAEQDGLLHVSQLPEEMVADDRPKVAAGAELTVYITHFDSQTGKLSLSMREVRETSRQRRTAPASRRDGGADRPRRPFDDRQQRPERAPVTRTFGPDRDEQVRARKQVENMSLTEKLAALGDKFRTKI
jgi:transcriptional accessory protein Tex/SPT6